MAWGTPDILADLSAQSIARIRLISMLVLLAGTMLSGYLAANRFGLPEYFAKKIMTAVLVFFQWPIALLVIWKMQLSRELVWVPVAGLLLMLVVIAVSAGIFHFFAVDKRARLTLIFAAGFSNLGYTSGAFVCYALFGTAGLAVANVYLLLWLPAVYLIFLPLLQIRQMRTRQNGEGFKLKYLLDLRMLVIPAVIAGIVLNLADVEFPSFVTGLHIVDILVYIASGLSFFAIALGVSLSRLKNYINLYFPLAAIKFLLTPIIAILLIWLLEMTGRDLTVLVRNVIMVLSVTPSAVLMVVISNVFDLDGPLASALWVVTTAVFVVVVVPVLYFVFN